MAQYIFDRPERPEDTDHRVRRMVTIPCSGVIAADFERRFNTLCIEAYGMTEICLPSIVPLASRCGPVVAARLWTAGSRCASSTR